MNLKPTVLMLRNNLWIWSVRVAELDGKAGYSFCCGVGRVAWNAYISAQEACRLNGCLDE